MEQKKCTWTGGTDVLYTFDVFPYPTSFEEGQAGNYIYCKLIDGKYYPIYIGEGDLCDRCSDNHHKAKCIKAKNPTHIHVHINSNDRDRFFEETDLLAGYPNAYTPKGCNEKEGG